MLTACADSSTPEKVLPEIIEKISFPFILDNTLYNFEPKTGEKEKLAESNKSMMISLDIDQSETTTEDENTFLEHSALPEYVVYVEDQTIRLYDLYTTDDRVLISFSATNNQEENEYICDIKNLTTLDLDHLSKKEILYKDEKGFYVKTSTDENCVGDASSFKYLQIKIVDSFTETYTIRRTILLKHAHQHTHQHDHEPPHDHDHAVDIDDIENHLHKHEHEHDFLYVDMDEHKYADDPDIVHNDSKNQEIEAETHPVLVGKKYVVDQALMYSGKPIVDLNNKQFGYLGFNNSDPEPSYKFYEIIGDELDKFELWKLTNNEFSIQPDNTFGTIQEGFENTIFIEFNWKLIKLNIEDLFDDDRDKEREFSINNPIFSRTPTTFYTSVSYSINENKNIIAIRDQNTLYSFFSFTPPQNTYPILRTLNDKNLDEFEFNFLGNQIMAIKRFSENSVSLGTSITSIALSNGLERTLVGKYLGDVSYEFFPDEKLALSLEDLLNTTWNAQLYNENLGRSFPSTPENTIWAEITDKRTIPTNSDTVISIVQSDNSTVSDVNGKPVLVNPSLHLFDNHATDKLGDSLALIPGEVADVHSITMLSELFGTIKIEESTLEPEQTKTYFFNPDDPTDEIKLMYEDPISL